MIRTHWRAILALTLIVLLANAGILSGAFICDPETLGSSLATSGAPGIVPGSACYVDPAVALLTQPLGYLGAQDWLHGIIPWWNPYSGVGMPLAAEVQNESFFLPFVLLLHFHNGWFLQRMLFQLLSGIFTYAFLMELRLGTAAALLGGALFSLNGTFILTAGTVTAPIFCLPLLLLGIEHTWHAATANRRMGWSLVPLALAGSIYAGFPETAYLNSLLAGCWTLLRLAQSPGPARARFLGKMLLATGIGLALTLPLVLPFLAYLQSGNSGMHDFTVLGDTTLPVPAAPLQMLPLFYGAIAQFAPPGTAHLFKDIMWVRIGGWFGCAPVLLACYALVAKAAPGWRLPARALLAAWIILWEARDFGAPGLITAFNLIPGMARVDLIRYSGLSVEFAVFVLAAYGFDDLSKRLPCRRAHLLWALAGFLACLALSLAPVLHLSALWFHDYPRLRYFAAASFTGTALTVLILLRAMLRGRGMRAAQASIIAGGVVIFLLPQLAGPRSATVDRQGITFLQKNIGLSRFYTTGPFAPNFPAMYGIAAFNFVQIPAPKMFVLYVQRRLFTSGDILIFLGYQAGQISALQKNLAAYEVTGIKYVGAAPGTTPFWTSLGPPTGPGVNQYISLLAGQSLSGTISLPPGSPVPLSGLTVTLGTFGGATAGSVAAQLCQQSQCTTGQAALPHSAYVGPVIIPFSNPLTITPGQPLTYRLIHPTGNVTDIWLAPDLGAHQNLIPPPGTQAPTGLVPILKLQQAILSPTPTLVFQSPAMDIYQLPNPAPYAQTIKGTCTLAVLSRQKMQTTCAQPATLIRREMIDPGWHATVNGAPTPVRPILKLFQQVALPAGTAVIRFSYIPPHTHLACAIAILALLLWLACARAARRQNIKKAGGYTPPAF